MHGWWLSALTIEKNHNKLLIENTALMLSGNDRSSSWMVTSAKVKGWLFPNLWELKWWNKYIKGTGELGNLKSKTKNIVYRSEINSQIEEIVLKYSLHLQHCASYPNEPIILYSTTALGFSFSVRQCKLYFCCELLLAIPCKGNVILMFWRLESVDWRLVFPLCYDWWDFLQ